MPYANAQKLASVEKPGLCMAKPVRIRACVLHRPGLQAPQCLAADYVLGGRKPMDVLTWAGFLRAALGFPKLGQGLEGTHSRLHRLLGQFLLTLGFLLRTQD